ncbi:hypothetical protein T10_3308 [Trichinella papuae]|uniref:Uncharacterized protein n=1 Tax=Trichinella papuae TaxID=268474 RepID=A0A0V1M501_9BILA|nr:hypothetical protein T10_3308 [Trichinella papuae]
MVNYEAQFWWQLARDSRMLGRQGEVPVALKQLFNLLSIASCATWRPTSFASSLGFIDLINMLRCCMPFSS